MEPSTDRLAIHLRPATPSTPTTNLTTRPRPTPPPILRHGLDAGRTTQQAAVRPQHGTIPYHPGPLQPSVNHITSPASAPALPQSPSSAPPPACRSAAALKPTSPSSNPATHSRRNTIFVTHLHCLNCSRRVHQRPIRPPCHHRRALLPLPLARALAARPGPATARPLPLLLRLHKKDHVAWLHARGRWGLAARGMATGKHGLGWEGVRMQATATLATQITGLEVGGAEGVIKT